MTNQTVLATANVQKSLNGQKNINGMLCQVDWMLIEALKRVATALEQRGDNVAALKELLTHTDQLSAKVANEDPPGCNPRNRTS